MQHNLLSSYGECIAVYKGNGTLTLKDKQALPCTFEAGQLCNGKVLLLCDFLTQVPFLSAEKFEGTTSEGFQVFTTDKFLEDINYLPDLPPRPIGTWAAFSLRQLTVQMAASVVHTVKFGITNFSCINGFTLNLEQPGDLITLSIRRIKGYDKILDRLQALKNIDITCEVIGTISSDKTIEQVQQVIEDLCYLLSVARGTKVQWVYCDQYDVSGTCLSRLHSSRITKAYHPLPMIDPENDNETKQFIEEAYKKYLTRRNPFKLTTIIDSLLDANAEHDHLQLRGLKLAITMETLKNVFLEQLDVTALPKNSSKRPFRLYEVVRFLKETLRRVSFMSFWTRSDVIQGGDYILPSDHFDKSLIPKFKKALQNILTAENVPKSEQEAICNNLKGLNRKSFKSILKMLFAHLDLTIEPKDMKLFIDCRNSLVHRGRYRSEIATEREKKRYPQLANEITEYFFLVNILNKVMLRLLGYRGIYLIGIIQVTPSMMIKYERARL